MKRKIGMIALICALPAVLLLMGQVNLPPGAGYVTKGEMAAADSAKADTSATNDLDDRMDKMEGVWQISASGSEATTTVPVGFYIRPYDATVNPLMPADSEFVSKLYVDSLFDELGGGEDSILHARIDSLGEAVADEDSILHARADSIRDNPNRQLALYALPDSSFDGDTYPDTAGEALSFGELCYKKSDGRMWKADSDTSATLPGLWMVADKAGIAADSAGDFLRDGTIRASGWNWTPGKLLRAFVTAGQVTELDTIAVGEWQQFIGSATSPQIIDFDPEKLIILRAKY